MATGRSVSPPNVVRISAAAEYSHRRRPCGLSLDVDHHLDVIADRDEAPGLLRRDGDVPRLVGHDVDLEAKLLRREALDAIGGCHAQRDRLAAFQGDLARRELELPGGDRYDGRLDSLCVSRTAEYDDGNHDDEEPLHVNSPVFLSTEELRGRLVDPARHRKFIAVVDFKDPRSSLFTECELTLRMR